MNVDPAIMRAIGALIVRNIKARMRAGQVSPSSRKSKGTTLVKRGALMRSVRVVRIEGSSVIITAGGPGIPYARIHQEGGIIKPKNAQYLAIPLTAAAAVRRPRDFEDTFIAKGVIFQKQEGSDKPIALYALKKQVTMPARPYLTVNGGDLAQIKTTLEKALARKAASELRLERG